MKLQWLVAGLVVVTIAAAVAAWIGWSRYYAYKQSTEYQLNKSFFMESYRRSSEQYTPATVVSTEGNKLTYRIPRQEVRNGEIYAVSELREAVVSDATQFYTFASTSLGMTVYTIPPGTEIRILAPPDPVNPDVRYAQIIYASIDAIYPPDTAE